jgi:AcrR family transcriptional regulator
LPSKDKSPTKQAAQKAPTKRRSGREVVERLKIAATEEFGENGYSRTKTAAIAQRAGVSENLLFKHFGSKANLFNDTVFTPIEKHFAEFSESHLVGAGGIDDREEVSLQYIAEMQAFIREHADAIKLLIVSNAFESGEVNGIDKVSGLHRYLADTSAMVRKRLDGQPNVDPGLVACISFASIVACEIFRDWLFPEGWGSDQEIGEAVAAFVLGGFRTSIAPR